MNAENTISPELQAKIDALTDEKLKKDVLFLLSGPGNRTATNEQIFNNRVASYEKAKAERAKWRQWRDEEVLAFVEHFKHEMPDDYAEFLRQERENNEIDDEVWWRVGQLADKWIPGLDFHDCTSLLGKVRGYMRAHVIERGDHHE
jgi:hypothetical protein